MRKSRRAWTAIILLSLSTPVFAAEQPALGFSPEAASDVQRRTDEAFAALGYAPMPAKAPPFIKRTDDTPAPPANNVMLFAGQYAINDLGGTVNPFTATHEDQGIVAFAYGHDFYRWRDVVVGVEVGTGLRFGLGTAGELWGGVNFRYTGFVLFNTVRIGGGITVGFSGITKATGIEAQREIKDNGSATLLAYLGPELTMALVDNPNWELVYRIQHRSGAYGVIAHFIEGANANTVGIRYRY
jgi:hypothetical protein